LAMLILFVRCPPPQHTSGPAACVSFGLHFYTSFPVTPPPSLQRVSPPALLPGTTRWPSATPWSSNTLSYPTRPLFYLLGGHSYHNSSALHWGLANALGTDCCNCQAPPPHPGSSLAITFLCISQRTSIPHCNLCLAYQSPLPPPPKCFPISTILGCLSQKRKNGS